MLIGQMLGLPTHGIEIVERVAGQIGNAPILLVITSRGDYHSQQLADDPAHRASAP